MPGPVFLSSDELSLHPIEESDGRFCQRLLNDPRVRTRIASTDPITAHGERAWIENQAERDGFHFLICRGPDAPDTDASESVDETEVEPVGTIGLTPKSQVWGTAEIGYSIAPEHWGNGYATDAVSLVCEYAFEERRLSKLFAITLSTNPGSGRVLEKNGFEQEGRLREEAFVDGERVDALRYGLLATEWFENGDATSESR